MIGDTVLGAEGPDQGPGILQPIAGHVGKEVVLNLIVQPAVHVIDNRVGNDVPGRQYLLPQVIEPGIRRQDRHSLVVGSKNRAQMQSKQSPMNRDEQDPVPEGQERENQREIGSHCGCHDNGFQDRIPHPLQPRQEGDAGEQQAVRREQEHRVEPESLMADEEPRHSPRFQRSVLCESEYRNIDIAVMPDLVGADVVLDVLVLPPTGRQTRNQRGQHHEHVVPLHRPEDLPVSGVMPQEGELRERDGHQRRICHLHPQAVENDQYRYAGKKKRESAG